MGRVGAAPVQCNSFKSKSASFLQRGLSPRFNTPQTRTTRGSTKTWPHLVGCRLRRRSPIWRVRRPLTPARRFFTLTCLPLRTAEAKAAMRKVLEVLCANQAELQALIVACGDDQVSLTGRLLQRDAAAPTRRRPSFSSSCHLHCHLSPATSAAAKEDGLADPGPAEGPCGSNAGGGLPSSAYGCAAPRPCSLVVPSCRSRFPSGDCPSFWRGDWRGGRGESCRARAHCAPLANPWRRLSRAQASCRA